MSAPHPHHSTTLSILGAIVALLFYAFVVLPLATVTTRQLVLPWAHRQGLDKGVPEWAAVLVVFFAMAVCFWLRAHVTVAEAS